MRGSLRRVPGQRHLAGSIPACAGQPPKTAPRVERRRVYPRVCGAATACVAVCKAVKGLSPRVRGSLEHVVKVVMNHRVYPRVCGAALAGRGDCPAEGGLSPRVRGSRHLISGLCEPDGSIPACAGQPIASTKESGRVRVYPRVCGAAVTRPFIESPVLGLSPRVRGSRDYGLPGDLCAGSIPACAGQPLTTSPYPTGVTVYPRVCGAAAAHAAVLGFRLGLSPRVRGSQDHALKERGGGGSIPACAGQPSPRQSQQRSPTVYPRVCGAAKVRSREFVEGLGLSPRVRGSQFKAHPL